MVLISLFNFLNGNSGVSKSSLNYIFFSKKIKEIFIPGTGEDFKFNIKVNYFHQKNKFFNLNFNLLYKILSKNRNIIIDGNSAAVYLLILVLKIHLINQLIRDKSLLKIYLRTHNLDIDVRFSFVKKIITYISEYILYRLVHEISVVSVNDKLRIKKLYRVNAILIPNKINLNFYNKTLENNFKFDYVTFMGSTEYFPNFCGLDFLYSNILNYLSTKNIYLVHCGSSSNFLKHHPNLVKIGECSDEYFYSTLSFSLVNLVPIELGGGTKIKLIESIACGIPTLSFDNLSLNLQQNFQDNPIYTSKENFVRNLDVILNNYFFFKNKAILNGFSYRKEIEKYNRIDF